MMEYYLFATNDCNLKCSYCSVLVDAEKYNIPMQPQYDLVALNNFIISTQDKYNDNSTDIVFFGGEPTLRYDFIENVIASQAELREQFCVRYVLHTNGLLLEKIPDNILPFIQVIMLSINYTKIPPYNLHSGYFSTIIRGLRKVRSSFGIKVIGRLTITEKTSLYIETTSLMPFFDYLYWQIENCISFQDYELFNKAYTYEVRLLFDIWMSFLRKGVMLKIIPFIACVNSNLVLDTHPESFTCGFNKSMIYIQTNGTCFTCAEDMMSEKNVIGDIFSGIAFDTYSLDNTKCCECIYRSLCHGRCARMHKEFMQTHINEYCQLNQVMFDLVKNNLAEINELIGKYRYDFYEDSLLLHFTELVP